MADQQFNSLEDALGAVVTTSEAEVEAASGTPGGATPPDAPSETESEAASTSASEGEESESQESQETTESTDPAQDDTVDVEADTDPAPTQNERLGRIAKRLRDDRRTVARELEEVRRLKSELENLRSSANPWAEVAEMVRKDPVAGLERFAEMSGTTTAAVLEKYARAAIGKPEDPKDAVAQMRQELEAFKQSLKQREEAELQRQQQVQLQQHIEAGVDELMQIQKPEFSSKYPYASALDPDDLRNECRNAIQYLVANNMTMPADQVAEVIEKKIARLVKPIIDRKAPSSGSPGNGNGKKPTVSSPLTPPKKPTITNQDAAGAIPSKKMTDEERIRAAAEAIGKGINFE